MAMIPLGNPRKLDYVVSLYNFYQYFSTFQTYCNLTFDRLLFKESLRGSFYIIII